MPKNTAPTIEIQKDILANTAKEKCRTMPIFYATEDICLESQEVNTTHEAKIELSYHGSKFEVTVIIGEGTLPSFQWNAIPKEKSFNIHKANAFLGEITRDLIREKLSKPAE